MTESLDATFERIASAFGVRLPATRDNLAKLQRKQIDIGGQEEAVARMVAPGLLSYNTSWDQIRRMLQELLSAQFRERMLDDSGGGWVYSWHCMDHLHYAENPRCKDVGYGNVFRFYRSILEETGSMRDELNWHFHPLAITGRPLHAATSYTNSYGVLNEILCRRIVDDSWFPVVNRPGFHSERPDSHAFLEQWIPFDYANQSYEEEGDQRDAAGGRFGDWRRAPRSWRGYHPSHDDYQQPGTCRRTIFRCLNLGSRLRMLNIGHVHQAFAEAKEHGGAILAFSDHDYRDLRPDVELVRAMLAAVRPQYPGVALRFSGAEAAARDVLGIAAEPAPRLSLRLSDDRLVVQVEQGTIFGSQPFLALKTREGRVHHDNLDVQEPNQRWTYVLDDQTLAVSLLSVAGVGAAGRFGAFDVARVRLDS